MDKCDYNAGYDQPSAPVPAAPYPPPSYAASNYPPPADVMPLITQPQPQTHTTTVVNIQQPGLSQPQQRDWRVGLCGGCEDMSICLLATFCPLCYLMSLSSSLNENCCLCFCMTPQGALSSLRTKVRTQENIQGDICDDFSKSGSCHQCTLCQLGIEEKYIRNRVNTQLANTTQIITRQ